MLNVLDMEKETEVFLLQACTKDGKKNERLRIDIIMNIRTKKRRG